MFYITTAFSQGTNPSVRNFNGRAPFNKQPINPNVFNAIEKTKVELVIKIREVLQIKSTMEARLAQADTMGVSSGLKRKIEKDIKKATEYETLLKAKMAETDKKILIY